MKLEEREQGLLKLVEDYRETECRALLEAAEAEADELIRAAYRRERARLHERVIAERAQARARVHAARAERDTRERAGADRANARLLELAWPLLREALLERWQDPDARRAWVRHSAEQALRSLPHGQWRIRHAPGWERGDQEEITETLVAGIGCEPSLVADGSLAAGLVIEGGEAKLDASLDGLMSDRTRLEARLLALMASGAGQ